jgi:energy-coupling factor transport system permease protein
VLSVVGLSLVGAAVHNVTQIGLVYALLARHAGVFLLLPWLGLSAVVMGWITGLVAAYACRRLAEYPTHFDSEPPRPRVAGERDGGKTRAFSPHLPSLPHKAAGDTVHNSQFEPGNSTLHRLPAAAKIVAAAALALLVVWLHEVWCFAVVTLLLCGSALMGRAFSLRWFAVIFKLRLFLVFAFLAPLLLVQTGVVWWRAGPLIVTDDGVVAAARVVWRIALLMLGTALLVRTTSPEALAAGLGKVLAPLRAAGLPTGRFVALLSLAWSFVPPLWDRAHEVVRQQIGKGTWKHILPALGDTMAAMYREADLAGG